MTECVRSPAGIGTANPCDHADEPRHEEDGERECDDLSYGSSGKKRKGPGHLGRGAGGAHEHDLDHDADSASAKLISTHVQRHLFPITTRLPRTRARILADRQRELFMRRKAAFINLYLDAQQVDQAVANAKNGNPSTNRKSGCPDVSEFEKLLPFLADLGAMNWPCDLPGWREGETQNVKVRKARRTRQGWGKAIERKGWTPEGSFEFEMASSASRFLRLQKEKEEALLKCANGLRAIILSSPVKPRQQTSAPGGDTLVSEAPFAESSTGGDSIIGPEGMSNAPSKDSMDSSKNRKKLKKKKRSVLANQANPHHVDNYRPTRMVSPHSNPYEPYPHHLTLLSPPSMMFLAARPRPKGSVATDELYTVRPGEDEYICSVCEYDLYYGSEKLRRAAVRRRKREIKRKQTIQNRAKNVAEGKGKIDEDEDDYETGEDGDEEDHSGCHDCVRCSCGRWISRPKPDKDPDPDPCGSADLHCHPHPHDAAGDHHHDHADGHQH
ncbi:hypothetical protein IAU60_006602 [Kwoniella sp. DSM 27419]